MMEKTPNPNAIQGIMIDGSFYLAVDDNGKLMCKDCDLREQCKRLYAPSGHQPCLVLTDEWMRLTGYNREFHFVKSQAITAAISTYKRKEEDIVASATAWVRENTLNSEEIAIRAYVAGYFQSPYRDWLEVERDNDGFATDECLDMMMERLPFLIYDTAYCEFDVVNLDNATEWRGDIERHPRYSHWKPISKP